MYIFFLLQSYATGMRKKKVKKHIAKKSKFCK